LDLTKKPKHSPIVKKWYDKGGSIEQLDDGSWKYTDWEYNSVVYVGGFPVFASPHKRQEEDISNMQGDCTNDFDIADELALSGPRLAGNTWHHHENLVTMQEVDRKIHDRFTHYGARSILKKKRKAATTVTTASSGSKLRNKKP